MSDLLNVRDLKVHFPIVKGVLRNTVGYVRAVDGISFRMKKGEVLGLVGESGSGKSTVARACARLIDRTEGHVLFEGENVFDFDKKRLNQFRTELQFVFQDPYTSLNPRRTIGQSIGEALLYHRIVFNRMDSEEIVSKRLGQVGLSADMSYRYPHELSGGQQQRVCIARALSVEPKLIVCDEAVSALDVSVQAQILNLLIDLKDQFGLSYLFISHDLSVVRHLADRVIVMQKGKVVEKNETEELFANPQNPYTKRLLDAIPKILISN